MGKEDETHEEFQLELNDQLHELSKTITYFYDGKTKSRRPTIVKVFNQNCNQPARAKLTGVGGHSGIHTLTWGLTGSVKTNLDIIVSCLMCYTNLLKSPDGVVPDCNKCCNWNLLSPQAAFEVSAAYPRNDVDDLVLKEDENDLKSRRFAFPGPITIESLKAMYF
jgi:hypothetical protein